MIYRRMRIRSWHISDTRSSTISAELGARVDVFFKTDICLHVLLIFIVVQEIHVLYTVACIQSTKLYIYTCLSNGACLAKKP